MNLPLNSTFKQDNNKDYSIRIKKLSLAEVKRLHPSKNTDVLLMETNENVTKGMVQIKSATGFLSPKIKDSFETVTFFKPVKIFITAEDNHDTQYPGNQMVLTTNKF